MVEANWKISLLTIIVALLLMGSFWYYFNTKDDIEQEEVETNENIYAGTFSISIEKEIFNESEPINVTFSVCNNQNKTVNASVLWPYITLDYRLWDSAGRRIIMYPQSGPMYPSTQIGPKEVYKKTFDIKREMGHYYNTNNSYSKDDRFEFIPDIYIFNATYRSFHLINTSNFREVPTLFYSNSVTFRII